MKIHPEGRRLLAILVVVLVLTNLAFSVYRPAFLTYSIVASSLFFLAILQFFRHPRRILQELDSTIVYAPADGKVVVIEETYEDEYFQDKRLQVSIFMSPVNVHVNRNPISGKVSYFKYHPGRYRVAWHPKSSEENERTTVVIDNGRQEVMMRQIAGAMAKRIKSYLQVGDEVQQGSEMGFIKFGSRVDLYLPLDTEIEVEIGQKVKGNRTVIARLE